MMKLKNYMMGIATVTLLASMASCQKNDEVGNAPATGVEVQNPANEDSYLSININLPTTVGQTRANDVFDDGSANEYAVENAYLVIFAGTPDASFSNEDAMTLRSAYELNPQGFTSDGTNAQITTTKQVTAKVLTENIISGESAFAFVILNKHNFFDVKKSLAAGKTHITSLFLGTTDLMEMTFGDFKQLTLDESNKDFSNQSFTMTNMPHIHKPGITANPYTPATPAPWTLMEINKNNIKKTEAEATANPAVEVDVERVVAKVTVKQNPSMPTAPTVVPVYPLGDTTPVTFTLLGWFIDNTNPAAYVTRNTAEPGANPWAYLGYKASGSSSYRMASANYVHTEINGGNKAYRTYWGVDPNYDADATGLVSEAGKIVDNTIMVFDDAHVLQSGRLRAAGTSYYCAENTFDVAHQTVKNTTRVVVAAQFNGGNSFFTIESVSGTIFTAAQVADQVKNLLKARVNVSNWIAEYFKPGITDAEILSLWNVDVTGNGKTVGDTTKPGTAGVSLALAADGTVQPLLAPGKTLAATKTAWNSILANQNAYIAENVIPMLSFYETGVCYYQALIRHFDESETPWTGDVTMTNTTTSIYNGNNAQDYLGRYGVLRNNWYDITIDGVKAIGTPTVPELTDDPDDTVETYISVKINIMPWAKRTQSVIL